jgi:hypothetical protein
MALIRTNGKVGNSTGMIIETNTEAVMRYEQKAIEGTSWALVAIFPGEAPLLLKGFGSRNELEMGLDELERAHGKGPQGRVNWVYKEEDV